MGPYVSRCWYMPDLRKQNISDADIEFHILRSGTLYNVAFDVGRVWGLPEDQPKCAELTIVNVKAWDHHRSGIV
jgi:hypothetical protein